MGEISDSLSDARGKMPPQDPVSRQVAEAVVDLLELPQVQHDESNRTGVFPRLPGQKPELIQIPPVEHTGQFIQIQQLPEPPQTAGRARQLQGRRSVPLRRLFPPWALPL